MLTIRPFNFSDDDYEAAVVCWNRNFPEVLETAVQYRHRDESREPHRFFKRLIAEAEGQVVATAVFCETWWQKHAGKHYLEVIVLPEQQGKGFGTAIYQEVLKQLAERKPTMLSTYTGDDQQPARRFLEKRGFSVAIREPASRLDLTAFTAQEFAPVCNQVTTSGITIEPLTELQATTPDWAHQMWDLHWIVIKDVPGTAPWERESFEEYQREILQNPEFEPAGHFIARDGQRLVGLTNLWPTKADPKKLWCGLTGVIPEYRRRGIAIALKVRAAEYARQQGYHHIDTDNEEKNPMYGINLRLGFSPLPAWLGYELTLESDENLHGAAELATGTE
ncbi:MAG: GNAT family N-acetyltransferase [Candidatus Delongbacteria bacterium]|nr:GNAT family N-acetyltransferase [Candidatus Delongbacteria bacterium]